jgi:uncharacterized protein
VDAEPLPRRPFLGLHVNAHGDGLIVVAVLGASAAAAAGVRARDLLVAVDGERVTDALELLAIARERRAGAEVTFDVMREGRSLALAGVAPPLPVESSVEMGTVTVRGHRLRTFANVPHTQGPHPAILYLQGIRARSCEEPLEPQAPLRQLVEGWARDGLVVFRVERSGVGDSEGPSCALSNLEVELETYLAALDRLRARPDVDPKRIFLFGQSLGAMTAPLVALDRLESMGGHGGVIAFGASAARWVECVVDTTRRQLRLRGMPEERVLAQVALWSEMHTLVCRQGWTPERAFEERPHLRPLRSLDCIGETYAGRHVSLFQQLDAIDLVAAWTDVGRAGIPVLVLRGEYDWICSREEGEAIARAVGPSARYVELPRIGHDWLTYDSLESSRRSGEGSFRDTVGRAVQTFTSPQPSGNTQP